MTIEQSIEKNGFRKTAIKMIDAMLSKKAFGFTSSDLADSIIFMDGIDSTEEFLRSGDTKEAWSCADETAEEMLLEEGFDFEEALNG